jgi:transposase
MTPTEVERLFIELWQQGLRTAEIPARLGIKATTAQSRARRLQERGLIQLRPRGGDYPSLRARVRQDGTPHPRRRYPPVPPAAERKEIQQWTVRLSKARIEHLKAVAYERRIRPGQLLEALAWQALND